MSACKACNNIIDRDVILVSCDGICRNKYHATCIKRNSKSSFNYTCAECTEIKPCHVLRFMEPLLNQFESLKKDQQILTQKVNMFMNKFASLETISDDLNVVINKLEGLTSSVSITLENTDKLLDSSRAENLKLSVVSGSVEDIHALVSGSELPIFRDAKNISSTVEDIRKDILRVEGDINVWKTCFKGMPVFSQNSVIGTTNNELPNANHFNQQQNLLQLDRPHCSTQVQQLRPLDKQKYQLNNKQQRLHSLPSQQGKQKQQSSQIKQNPLLLGQKHQPKQRGKQTHQSEKQLKQQKLHHQYQQPLIILSPMPENPVSLSVSDISSVDQSVLPIASATDEVISDPTFEIVSGPLSQGAFEKVSGDRNAIASSVDELERELVALSPIKTIFVSRLPKNTTVTAIVNHISRSLPSVDSSSITVRKFALDERKDYSSFQINVGRNGELFNLLSSKSAWPENTVVHDFFPNKRRKSAKK